MLISSICNALPRPHVNNWFSSQRPLLIAHRGASADAPENTLAAFNLALEQGADGIEFDVQLAADGVPVVIHDGRLERTTNGQGPVRAQTAAALQALDAGDGRGVPTLDQLFESIGRRLLYNVEIKNWEWRDGGAEAAVAACIRAHNLADCVVVSSFNPWALRRARRYMPSQVPLALLYMAGPLQISRFLFQGEAEHPHFPLVDEAYMARAVRQKRRVHVWTVDDPVEAQRLVQLGVHAIISNKPRFLREKLVMHEG
jgi:glycerophosphoryl diester phosphodiesterase